MEICREFGGLKAYLSCNSQFFFITITSRADPVKDINIIEQGFALIADYCKKNNGAILHERTFAAKSLYLSVCEARKKAYIAYEVDHLTAFTYIDCKTIHDDCFAGINVQGIFCNSHKLKQIVIDGYSTGNRWADDDIDMIFLHEIHSNQTKKTPYEQTKDMFYISDEILQRNRFNFKNVCRTWIYLDHILNQYDEFNKGRNEVFHKLGLLGKQVDTDSYELISLPASTGINGANIHKSNGIMDVLALKAKSDKVSIYNENGKLQNSAFRYGSAFARSFVVENYSQFYKLIYLSGTASIDKWGQTVYVDNFNGQIDVTFNTIKQLIHGHSMDLSNICEGTVFLKSREYLQDFLLYLEKQGLTENPFIITVADVCRDNLLFEIDATFQTDLRG